MRVIQRFGISLAGAATAVGLFSAAATAAEPHNWVYTGQSYYFAADCADAGNGGINNGSWKVYECINGSKWPWGHWYQLWVQH